jgi:beta-glucanase (GH16 family)
MPRTPTQAQAYPKSQPVPDVRADVPDFALTADWALLFDESFTTSNLDMRRWWTRQTHNDGWLDYLNDEEQRYREAGNHVMADGKLQLTALPHQGEFWPSGMIRSKSLFNLADGNGYFFECKGRVPGGKGVWPAWWLAGSERVPGDDATALWPPEIDIMEIVNNEGEDTLNMCNMRCQVLDWATNPQQYWIAACHKDFNPEWGTWWAPYYFNEGFHAFGLHYQRPNFAFYIDRQWIANGMYDWVTDDRQPSPPAHLLLNLAIGGSWAGRYGVDDTAMPQSFDIEYVRVWQRRAQSTIGHDLLPV